VIERVCSAADCGELQAQSLWGDLLHLSTPLLEGGSPRPLNPQQLCMIIHAVATADSWTQAKPSRHWYNAYLAATQTAMQQQQQQQSPSSSSSATTSSSSSSSGGGGRGAGGLTFSPQGFSNMVWALGKLQRRPGSDWAAVLYSVTEPQLPGFSPQGLANLGLGLANMNLIGGLPRPSKPWADAFVESACDQLPGFNSQGLANLLW
jgi:hypothetical protein